MFGSLEGCLLWGLLGVVGLVGPGWGLLFSFFVSVVLFGIGGFIGGWVWVSVILVVVYAGAVVILFFFVFCWCNSLMSASVSWAVVAGVSVVGGWGLVVLGVGGGLDWNGGSSNFDLGILLGLIFFCVLGLNVLLCRQYVCMRVTHSMGYF
uniref:NADH dehydrogenase subunit 6 n=1 Tax=Graffilla buccinicola TaxID=84095 RepID=A0A7G5XUJ5_9PLAT|nr:NADH dehydrogenase subunit 6 [Graffilla buccinicola]QNA49630.1 NADH dehydrogenase subunit 6 [Graffilla buccinicola]